MNALARQSVAAPAPADQYVPIGEAAAHAGTSVRTWARRALEAAGRTAGGAPLAYQAVPPGGRGRPTWLVHRSLDPRLAAAPAADVRGAQQRAALLTRYPRDYVELAYRRLRWLLRWRELCGSRRESAQALAVEVAAEAAQSEPDLRLSARTLWLWWQRHQAFRPDGSVCGVEGLVPRWGEQQARGKRQEAGEGAPGADRQSTIDNRQLPRSPEAVACFYSLYHGSALKVASCHELTVREARQRGWSWPASYAATTAWLRKTDDLPLTCLLREGRNAYCRRYLPHNDVDYSAVQPGAFYVSDHCQLDFWARDEQWQPVRLWLTAVQDCRSRCIVGWHIGLAPHQDAILRSLTRAFAGWALPEVLRIDNGKDFRAQVFEGVTRPQLRALRRELGVDWREQIRHARTLATCDAPAWGGIIGELGLRVIYAQPYSPWSKMIERFFGTMHTRFCRSFATYCGHKPGVKPDGIDDLKRGVIWVDRKRKVEVVDPSVIPSIDDVRRQFAEYLVTYHHHAHRGDGMDGRSPLAVWHTATRLRRADPDALLFLMQTRGLYKVHSNGVTVQLAGGHLRYGNRCPALKPFVGREILIAVDPDDVSSCVAFTADRQRFIARLPANERIPALATAEDLREVLRAVQRERKVLRTAASTRTRARLTVAERLAIDRSERAAELRATGTMDAVPLAVSRAVQTGFEAALPAVRAAAALPPPLPPLEEDPELDLYALMCAGNADGDEADDVDESSGLTLADIAAAGADVDDEDEADLTLLPYAGDD